MVDRLAEYHLRSQRATTLNCGSNMVVLPSERSAMILGVDKKGVGLNFEECAAMKVPVPFGGRQTLVL